VEGELQLDNAPKTLYNTAGKTRWKDMDRPNFSQKQSMDKNDTTGLEQFKTAEQGG